MAKLPMPFNNPAMESYPGHQGMDFPQRTGTLVRANGRGVIINRGYTRKAGNFVEIRHDNGATIFSCHFHTLNHTPAVGTRVDEGTIIGEVGSTGNSSGPHLHQENSNWQTTGGYWAVVDSSRSIGGGGNESSGNMTTRPLKDIQTALLAKGYDPGAIDGIWGPKTKDAVKAFQAFAGLVIDGIYGAMTDAALFPAPKGYDGEERAGVHGPNPFGIPFTGGLQVIARRNGYRGRYDQNWGDGVTSGSMVGFVKFLRNSYGYVGNDVLGPNMWKAIQRWLKKVYGYEGEIDGIPGPMTRRAFNRADAANWAVRDNY